MRIPDRRPAALRAARRLTAKSSAATGGAGSAGNAVDLMEAFLSEAERRSRGEARLRRRATRALDSLSASEVLASMRSTARWVGDQRLGATDLHWRGKRDPTLTGIATSCPS
jgi:hypothetical protein